uniref:Uncharacterized protein n=1 Tax=Timema cristinae TaxID=61476 RepID=A0A7R9CY96_TIMCR|nr:unnamed protein product [Timema cristinae]
MLEWYKEGSRKLQVRSRRLTVSNNFTIDVQSYAEEMYTSLIQRAVAAVGNGRVSLNNTEIYLHQKYLLIRGHIKDSDRLTFWSCFGRCDTIDVTIRSSVLHCQMSDTKAATELKTLISLTQNVVVEEGEVDDINESILAVVSNDYNTNTAVDIEKGITNFAEFVYQDVDLTNYLRYHLLENTVIDIQSYSRDLLEDRRRFIKNDFNGVVRLNDIRKDITTTPLYIQRNPEKERLKKGWVTHMEYSGTARAHENIHREVSLQSKAPPKLGRFRRGFLQSSTPEALHKLSPRDTANEFLPMVRKTSFNSPCHKDRRLASCWSKYLTRLWEREKNKRSQVETIKPLH